MSLMQTKRASDELNYNPGTFDSYLELKKVLKKIRKRAKGFMVLVT